MARLDLDRFARIRLLEGVTPIQRLERLERALGSIGPVPRLYVKRDDLTGLGGGGNKLRKLEFLLGDARAQGADTIITIGLFSLFNKPIDLTVIAALLTLVGYSMNDTIVTFDRIRENLRLYV